MAFWPDVGTFRPHVSNTVTIPLFLFVSMKKDVIIGFILNLMV